MGEREFDILLWGVTGWTGVHLAEYFCKTYGLESGVRWGLVGRSENKLEKLVLRLEEEGFEWIREVQVLVVDNLDEDGVSDAIRRTKVVATVAGPYKQFGESLVKACVENKTHYCDITGEAAFMKRMINKYDAQAKEQGVMIVHACGFDSIPSDLGVYLMVKFMKEQFGEDCGQIRGYRTKLTGNNLDPGKDGERGGGGSVASGLGIATSGFKSISDPYYLVPEDKRKNVADVYHFPQMLIGFERDLKKYKFTTTFPMAFVNEKVVRRSNHLLGYMYGRTFSYHEAQGTKSVWDALKQSLGVMVVFIVLFIPFLRKLATPYLPKTSAWPPKRPEDYIPGFFEFKFVGETKGGSKCIGTVQGVDEPGWTETSKMLGESAMTLLLDLDTVAETTGISGGVVTPAVLGDQLLDRLREREMVFNVTTLSKKES